MLTLVQTLQIAGESGVQDWSAETSNITTGTITESDVFVEIPDAPESDVSEVVFAFLWLIVIGFL